MSSKLNRSAYEQLVREDLEWLNTLPDTLERQHVIHIVADSVRVYYEEPSVSQRLRERIEQLPTHSVETWESFSARKKPTLMVEAASLLEILDGSRGGSETE